MLKQKNPQTRHAPPHKRRAAGSWLFSVAPFLLPVPSFTPPAGQSPARDRGACDAAANAAAAGPELSQLLMAYIAANGLGASDANAMANSLVGLLNSMEQLRETLRQIVAGNNFRLVYQPIVRLSDRQVSHHEALLRLNAGAHGFATDTQSFTSQIEAHGLFEALDLAVCANAQAVLWDNPSVEIAVNVSGRSLQSETFRIALLDNLPHPDRLIIEITETAEITDISAAAHAVKSLRDQGVRFCLDDFGTGYAAFRYLRELPTDYLKIDGSYVQAAMTSTRDRDVVSSMCGLARAAGAQVIAEQIETEAQADLMQTLGATYGQGWLLGYPSAAAFAA